MRTGEISEPYDASDPAAFRFVLGHFRTGVTIVTALGPDAPAGLTCQSFSSLSLARPCVIQRVDGHDEHAADPCGQRVLRQHPGGGAAASQRLSDGYGPNQASSADPKGW
jgi:hypothetical protein